ncbi:MAG: SHD1 domain-containing protein [Planctomycetota bacterium]
MAAKRRRLKKTIVAVAVCALLVAESTAAAKLFRRNRCKCVCQKPCPEVCQHEAPADCDADCDADCAATVTTPTEDAGSPIEPGPAAEIVVAQPLTEEEPLAENETLAEDEVPTAAFPPADPQPIAVTDPPLSVAPAKEAEPRAPEIATEQPPAEESILAESDDVPLPWEAERPEESLPPAATTDPAPEQADDEFDTLFAEDAPADPPAFEESTANAPVAQTPEVSPEAPVVDEEPLPWDEPSPAEEPWAVVTEPEPMEEPPAEEPQDDGSEDDDSWLSDFEPTRNQQPAEPPVVSDFEDLFSEPAEASEAPSAEAQLAEAQPTEVEPAETGPEAEEPEAEEMEPEATESVETEPFEQEQPPAVDPLQGLFAPAAEPAEEEPTTEPEGPAEEDAPVEDEPTMEEMFQGPRNRSSSSEPTDYRNWFDQTGRYSVRAEMLAATGDRVLLGGQTGDRWAIAYHDLSDTDLAFVQRELAALAKSGGATPALPVSSGSK